MKSYIYKLVLHVDSNSIRFLETHDGEEIYTFLRKKDAVDMYKRHVKCTDSAYCGVTLTKEVFNLSPRNNLRIALISQRGCESELIDESMYSEEMIENQKRIEEKEEHEFEYGINEGNK